MFVYDVDDTFGHLVNPVLHFPSDEEQDGPEGCLSLPDLTFDCRRRQHVVAHGQNVHGDPVTIEGSDLLARCVQHETDHLDGILFVDRLDPETKKAAIEAVRLAEWANQPVPVVKQSPHPLFGRAPLPVRLVFAGTPAPALPSPAGAADSGHEVAAVVTRPDAPAGRGRTLRPSPVKELALEAGIEVLTPAPPARRRTSSDRLRALAPDCCPVVAYGALVPRPVLDVPRLGWVNLHFSLLPAWRGAAPVQHALLAGDETTGASVFLLEEGLDTGPVYGVLTETVRPTDTAGRPARTARRRPARAARRRRSTALEAGQVSARPAAGRGRLAGPEDHRRRRPGRLDRAGPAGRPAGPRLHARPRGVDDAARQAASSSARSPVTDAPLPPGRAATATSSAPAPPPCASARCGPRARAHGRARTGLRGLRPEPGEASRDDAGPRRRRHGGRPPAPHARATTARRTTAERGSTPPGAEARNAERKAPKLPRRDGRPGPRGRLRRAHRRCASATRTPTSCCPACCASAPRQPRRRLRHRARLRRAARPAGCSTPCCRPASTGRSTGSTRRCWTSCGSAPTSCCGMRTPPHAAVSATVDLARRVTTAGPAAFVNAVLRKVAAQDLDEWLAHLEPEDDAVGGARARHSHPRWIVAGLPRRPAAATSTRPRPRSRPTTPARRCTSSPGRLPRDGWPPAAAARPGRGRRTPCGWPTAATPATLAAVRDGRAGVQDEGSQLVALALAAAPLDGPDRALGRPVRRPRRQGGPAAGPRRRARRRAGRLRGAAAPRPPRARRPASGRCSTADSRALPLADGSADRVAARRPVQRPRRAAASPRGPLAPPAVRPARR